MSLMYRCACGATATRRNLEGWTIIEPIYWTDGTTEDTETLHLCPTCGTAIRQMIYDTENDNKDK